MATESLDERPGYLVKRVQQLLRQASDKELRAIDLSMSQYAVLRSLSDHPDASSAELARRTFVTRQSLQDVLRGLQTAGLVTVADRPPAGRARPVALTAAGRNAMRAAEDVVAGVEHRMLAGLPTPDRRKLTELLRTCAHNLSEPSPMSRSSNLMEGHTPGT